MDVFLHGLALHAPEESVSDSAEGLCPRTRKPTRKRAVFSRMVPLRLCISACGRGKFRGEKGSAARGKPVSPISRPLPEVGHRDDTDLLWQFKIDDRVGKPTQVEETDSVARRHPRDTSSYGGVLLDEVEGCSHRIEELSAQSRATLLIPADCRPKLFIRFGFEPKGFAHRWRTSRSILCRTSSQAIPSDSPESTLAARFSISRAQASSAVGSGSPSRLERMSEASSARSSSGRCRACSRR